MRLLKSVFSIVTIALVLTSCDDGREVSEGVFPRKPIKVVVPFGPGGDSDTFARIMQYCKRVVLQILTAQLGAVLPRA